MKKIIYLLFLSWQGAAAQDVPVLFEPGLLPPGSSFGFTLSPDSKTALWVHSGGKRDTLRIMESTKVNGKWSTPAIASFSTGSGAWKDIDPIFSPDGKTVLFQSDRQVPGLPSRSGFDIWAVTFLNGKWSEPYHLGNVINSDASESYASISRNGDIYFMKEREGQTGNSDIYVSKKINGVYKAPENIGLPVNTEAFRESNPFISPDGDYLVYFSSDSAGLGAVDLYISFLGKGKWSQPQNLGQPVNSALAEFCPFYHEKEKRLYFSRQQTAGGRMIEDIYYISLDIEKYRKQKP